MVKKLSLIEVSYGACDLVSFQDSGNLALDATSSRDGRDELSCDQLRSHRWSLNDNIKVGSFK